MQDITGYIAFLDILGFSQLVMKDSFSMDFERYSNILNEAVRADNRDLQYVTFSDSIIINTKYEGEEHLQHLVQAIAEITFHLLTELGLPICGSISRGRFWRYKDDQSASVIIAGSPIIDAYQFEQKQDWIGVILSPEVIKVNPALLEYCQLKPPNEIEGAKEIQRHFPWPLLIQRYRKIPFQRRNEFDDQTFDGIVVVPQHHTCQEPMELIVDLDKYKAKLDQMLLFASEPSEQSKYGETSLWISEAKQNWKNIIEGRVWQDSRKD